MKTNNVTTLGSSMVGFFDVPMVHLQQLIDSPEGSEMVAAKCNHCDTILRCTKLISAFVACEPCITRVKAQQKRESLRAYWGKVCPPFFQDTSTTRLGWPRERWAKVMAVPPGKSIFLHGPSGTHKTRMALVKMQNLMNDAENGLSVKVVWPEQLEHFKGYGSENRMAALAEYDVILLDDPLLTACRDAKLADALKHIIDLLMRNKVTFIITSQLGESEFLSGNSYGDLKASDKERGAAIMRRIKEICEVIG